MNSFGRIAVIGGLSCAIAGFAPAAIGAEGPADKSASPGRGWYVGTGIGRGLGAKYKLNGQTISFDDRLQGATDKSPLIAINVVNAGIALSPSLLFGFSGPPGSQTGTLAGNDAHLQTNNSLSALTWYPAEQGCFVP